MSRHFIRLFKAIRELGMVNGCSLYYYYVYHRLFKSARWSSRQVRVSNASKPIWMRPGVSDWIVMERIFLDREYDAGSRSHDASMDALYFSIVATGKQPLVIDCGANVGLSSVWLSERFPRAVVVSIEPERDNFRIASLNAENFPNIVPVNAAISDRISRVTLSNDGDTPWAWKTEETDKGEVPTITIPDLINQNKDCVPLVVKVDIEGFEVNLFRDEAEWVDAVPLLVFEMHDWLAPWSGSGHAFFSKLARFERDYLVKGENVFSYSHRALQGYRP